MPDTLPSFDLLIRGGTVIDGTRAPRFDADIGIVDRRIAAIGALADHPAKHTLDAAGRIVAPGFIDAHTHDDQALLSQPDMSFKVSQGVTTVVAGNCGISIAPLAADTPLPSPLDLLDASGRGRYEDFAAYFEQLERTPAAVNVASLVGHTTLRVRTMSSIDRPAEADEIMAMQRLLDEALAAWTRDGGWAAFTADALAALQDVAERAPKGHDAVVVSSGGVIGALAAGLLGAPPATGIALNRVAVNGAITLVTVGRSGANLLSFNDHAHFAGPRSALLTYR